MHFCPLTSLTGGWTWGWVCLAPAQAALHVPGSPHRAPHPQGLVSPGPRTRLKIQPGFGPKGAVSRLIQCACGQRSVRKERESSRRCPFFCQPSCRGASPSLVSLPICPLSLRSSHLPKQRGDRREASPGPVQPTDGRVSGSVPVVLVRGTLPGLIAGSGSGTCRRQPSMCLCLSPSPRSL